MFPLGKRKTCDRPRTLRSTTAVAGGVRQLENEVDHLVALSADVILPELLPRRFCLLAGRTAGALEGTLRLVAEATESLERQVISATLEQNEWNKSRAILLGVSRPTTPEN